MILTHHEDGSRLDTNYPFSPADLHLLRWLEQGQSVYEDRLPDVHRLQTAGYLRSHTAHRLADRTISCVSCVISDWGWMALAGNLEMVEVDLAAVLRNYKIDYRLLDDDADELLCRVWERFQMDLEETLVNSGLYHPEDLDDV